MTRVFIVEDEAIVAMEVEDRLRTNGYEVCGHAMSGAAALRDIPAANPDLILLDVNLGRGISGMEVAERLRGVLEAPILFLSAHNDAELTQHAVRLGAVGYLTKPFSPHVLLANVELALLRHRTSEALKASERRFRAIFEHASVGVAEVDVTTGRLLRVNQRLCQITGYDEGELLARAYHDLTHPDDVGSTRDHFERSASGVPAVPLEVRCLRNDGALVWLNVSVSRLPATRGEPSDRALVIVTDTTVLRETAAALGVHRIMLNDAQRVASVGSWRVDLATGATVWTDETYRLYGVSRDTFTPSARSIVELLDPADRRGLAGWIEATASGHMPGPLDIRVRLPDGSSRVLRGQGTMITSASGQPEHIVGTVQDVTEQRAAEVALVASEERYRALFEQAIEGLFVTDLDGVILTVNPAFARMFGYESPKDLVGSSLLGLYRARTDRVRLHGARDSLDAEDGVTLEWCTRSGAVVVVEVRGRIIHNDRGEATHYQGFVRDVTAQRMQERTMWLLSAGLTQATGATFFERVATELAALVGVEVGFVGALLPGAPRRAWMLGYSVDGKARDPIEVSLEGTPCDAVFEGHPRVVAQGVQRQYPHVRELAALAVEGYAAAPLVGAGDQVIGHVGVMSRRPLDNPALVEATLKLVSQRVAAELERQRAEKRFSAVFDSAPDAMLIVDEHGRITMANEMATQTLGYAREELVGLSVDAIVPDADRRHHAMLRASFQAHGVTRRMGASRSRLWARAKDGTARAVEISLSPVIVGGRKLVVAALRDLTDRVRAEEERVRLQDQLRHAQKLDALGTLAGGIAHDFNNLLAAILGHVYLARQEPLADSVAEHIDGIDGAANRATDLVRQILTFSRQQPSRRVVTSIRPVLEEVVRLLRATLPAGIRIELEVGPDVGRASIDATQIHQVFMNLGTNAWHAIERATGTISFRLDTVEVEPGDPRVRPGAYVRALVTDDGRGMDAATMERVFEPFFTTKASGKGTGLGLSVVHGIVAEHHGVVTVSSEPGRGTTFAVYLPQTARAVDDPERPAPGSAAAAGAAHVLLIDDEKVLIHTTRHILERLGHRVTAFVRAPDALVALRADPRRFDVVVTDQNMPEVGGTEVARLVQALRPELPVILITGFQTPELDPPAPPCVRERLPKPFSAVALGEALARALSATRPG